MKLLQATLMMLALGFTTVSAQASTAQEEKNTNIVLSCWHEVVMSGHVDKASKFVADDFVDHDPNIVGGRLAFVEYWRGPGKAIAESLPNAPVKAFGKGDYVVVVWELSDKDKSGMPYKYNTYDILRVGKGKIVEHWDGYKRNNTVVASAKTATGAPSSPAPKFKNSPEEAKNEELVLTMYRDVLQYHNFDLAPKYIAANYIQHNPSDPPGRDGLIEELAKRFKPEPLQPQMKNRPNLIITKGDTVLMMSSRQVKDPNDPSKTYMENHFEMVRVENGLAQEHWDNSIGAGFSRN